MVRIVLQVLWLLVPAGVANMAPAIAAHYNWLPQLSRPIDFGLKINGTRIFGAHKTFRGFLVGMLGGGVTGAVQYFLRNIMFFESISLFAYESFGYAVFFGAVLGLAALLGDAIKSFFKRRLHISPGTSWKPLDQTDFVIGALVAAAFFTSISFAHVVVALVVFGVITFCVSVIGVALRIKKSI